MIQITLKLLYFEILFNYRVKSDLFIRILSNFKYFKFHTILKFALCSILKFESFNFKYLSQFFFNCSIFKSHKSN
jgi:hypothetical protein